MKYWVGLLFILTAFSVQAQEINVGLSNNAYIISRTIRLTASPQLQLHYDKSQLNVGPLFIMYNINSTSDQKFPKFTGVNASYHYLPFKTDRNLNFYLFADLAVQMIRNEWNSAQWDPDSQEYRNFKYESREFLTMATGGYGIKIKVKKRFEINQGIGLGLYVSATDNDELTSGAPEISDRNIQGYDDFDFCFSATLGLSYRL